MAHVALKRCISNLLSIFYPHRCPLCDELVNTGGACVACSANLHIIDAKAVLSLGGKTYLDGCVSCFAYEGNLKDAIHKLKYDGDIHLVNFFVSSLRERVCDLPGCDLITAVPATHKKLRKRGFNQSIVMGRKLARWDFKPFAAEVLVRLGDDISQVGLERSERIKNVKDAFRIADNGASVEGKRIMIVDDVMTTGATLNECAKVLKKSGANEVYGLTIARTL